MRPYHTKKNLNKKLHYIYISTCINNLIFHIKNFKLKVVINDHCPSSPCLGAQI